MNSVIVENKSMSPDGKTGKCYTVGDELALSPVSLIAVSITVDPVGEASYHLH